MISFRVRVALIPTLALAFSFAQAPKSQEQPMSHGLPSGAANSGQVTRARLVRVSAVTASTMAVSFRPPLTCDSEGNLFLRTDEDPVSAVRKVTYKGENLTSFNPLVSPDLKIDVASYFTLSTDETEVYQLIYPHKIDRYVFVYRSDGSLKSTIKLQPGFPFMPSKLAVFPSGQLLISGLEYDADRSAPMWPFTGIFDSNGQLLKEIELEDDQTLHDMAAAGDTRAAVMGNAHGNRAVSGSQVEIGSDGNAYLMRWTNPAIFYAISSGGEVVRRFTVDPGDSADLPFAMHIQKNRIAVLFGGTATGNSTMRIVDLEGHPSADYVVPTSGKDDPNTRLSAAFACYMLNPERFVFLGANDEHKLELWTAEPR